MPLLLRVCIGWRTRGAGASVIEVIGDKEVSGVGKGIDVVVDSIGREGIGEVCIYGKSGVKGSMVGLLG